MYMKGSILLVIPPILVKIEDEIQIDGDFANNLRAYLENFDTVTVACPSAPISPNNGLPNTIDFKSICGYERVNLIILPYPYREDRYIINYRSVAKLLRSEIESADYLLFSPHAPFDWSTLAAKLAIAMHRSYDMEADWHLENVSRFIVSEMSFGFRKLRKYIWILMHTKIYNECMKNSSVSLLQGQDVYDAYKDIAPNPKKVLNVQITKQNYISKKDLEEKISRIKEREDITISYAGRAIEMKGPLDWIKIVDYISKNGVKLQARWYGDGELLSSMRLEASALKIDNLVHFPGKVDREVVVKAMHESDIFLFCHRTAESPRCLVEALAGAAPIVGYGSLYAQDLVAQNGGGVFVEVDDWLELAEQLRSLDKDREKLAKLVSDAYQTAQLYDRDEAIQYRIDLIKEFVVPPIRTHTYP